MDMSESFHVIGVYEKCRSLAFVRDGRSLKVSSERDARNLSLAWCTLRF